MEKSAIVTTYTWLNFKTHFTAAYAGVQEYQRTAVQANFYGVHNMTAGIEQ